MFEDRKDILALIKRANKDGITQAMIFKFEKLKNERREFYLEKNELEEILEWKLIGQYGRQRKIRLLNTDENVKLFTKTAFLISHSDKEIETKLKLKTLLLLYGVEVPVASAILTICFPTEYSVIDFRNWRQLYNMNEKKVYYTANEYWGYLKKIKELAETYKVTTQEIDMAIWQYDKEQDIPLLKIK